MDTSTSPSTDIARPRPDWHAINVLFGQQSEVASLEQLNDRGLSRHAIARLVAADRLYSVAPRVYSARLGPPSPRARLWSALLGSPARAALGFTTAGEVLDLGRGSPFVHVVRAGHGQHRIEGVVRHRTVVLHEDDVVVVDGLRCTGVARTLIDCASLVGPDTLDAMLDRAYAKRLYVGDAINRVLRERRQAPGARNLRAALGRLDETAGQHRSEFERRTTLLIRESTRIPMPTLNAPLVGFRPDLRWLLTRAIVECDGRDFHSSPAQILADAQREKALLAHGFVLLRLRWSQVVYEPRRTLERIEEFVLANSIVPDPRVPGRIVF